MNRFTSVLVLMIAACQGSSAPAADEASASRSGEIDLEIGMLDGPAPYVFGRVSGVVEDSAGRIFVSDYSANEIRAFAPDGEFLFTFGREGAGPGELRGPCCLAIAPDGSLWARDGGNRRYVGFRITGAGAEPFATLRMTHFDGWHYAPLSFVGSEFIDTGYRISPTGEMELQRFYMDSSGTVLRSEAVEEPDPAELGTVVKGDASTRQFFPQPHGPRFLVAFGPDGTVASAVSSRFSIVRHDGDGTTTTIRGVDTEGPPLSQDERDAAERRLEAYIRAGGGSRADYPDIPQRKTPLDALVLDAAGQLWVVLNTPGDQPARAIVYDAAGRVAGERTWPRAVNLAFPAWLGRDHGVGIETDSLGVQRVVRVRFRD